MNAPQSAASPKAALILSFAVMTAAVLAAPMDLQPLPTGTLVVQEPGGRITLELAGDEVGLKSRNGMTRVEKVAAKVEAEGVRRAANSRGRSNPGEKADLIFYPAGEPRDEANRRWLTSGVRARVPGNADIAALAAASGAESARRLPYAPEWVLFTATPGAGNALVLAEAVKKLPGVSTVEPALARQRTRRFVPNDPFFAYNAANPGYQWHLKNTGENGAIAGIDVNITGVWDTFKGSGVRIGVVDDGMETTHPDLAPNADTVNDWDFNGLDGDPAPGLGNNHGTSCAGVAAGRGNNGIGISGAAPLATLVGMKLIAAATTDEDEADAFSWKSDIIDIKSNSWGPSDNGSTVAGPGSVSLSALETAVNDGRGGKGTVFFWAAGNGKLNYDNSNFDGWSGSRFVTAVAAVTDRGVSAWYSEPGSNILVCAPSNGGNQGVTTTDLTGALGYNTSGSSNYADLNYTRDFGGTSSACPLTAGCAALMLEARPALTWRDVQEILVRTAVKNDPTSTDWVTNGGGFHFHHNYGAGMVDTAAAVALAQTWTLLPPQQHTDFTQSGIAGAIPDASATGFSQTFTIPAAKDMRIEHVTVDIDYTHPKRSDLEISLISPTGTVSRLSDRRLSDNKANLSWTFLTTHHRGERTTGAWTVKIADRVATSTGTLNSAALHFYGTELQPAGLPVITSAASATGTKDNLFGYQVVTAEPAASFAVTAGTLPAGLTLNAFTGRITGTPTAVGTFVVTVSATNSFGTSTAGLTITIGLSAGALIADAVDTADIGWTTTGSAPWFWQTSVTHDGIDAARSGGGADYDENRLDVTITGPKVVRWWWKVSSNLRHDFYGVFLDAVEQMVMSGEVDWEERELFVPAGVHTLEWRYWRDAAGQVGLDSGFLDEVRIEDPAATRPYISQAPLDFAAPLNAPAALFSVATGPGPITYAWEKDGTPLPSVTGPVLSFSSLVPGDAGVYRVVATNSFGSTKSQPATLSVTTPAASATLGNLVEAPVLPWGSASPSWIAESVAGQTRDGVDAVRSAAIDSVSSTSLHTSVTGPGTLSFWWRVSSEQDYDFLTFRQDGATVQRISGTSGTWAQITRAIPAGFHTLSWTYRTDEFVSSGSNAGWLDQVEYRVRYADWATTVFTPEQATAGGITGLHDDPDNDGLDNFLEYALGGAPLVAQGEALPATAVVPASQLASSSLSITYRRRTDAAVRGLTYTLLFSTELAPATFLPRSVVESAVVPAGDGQTEWVTATAATLPGDGSRVFVQLRVTEP